MRGLDISHLRPRTTSASKNIHCSSIFKGPVAGFGINAGGSTRFAVPSARKTAAMVAQYDPVPELVNLVRTGGIRCLDIGLLGPISSSPRKDVNGARIGHRVIC